MPQTSARQPAVSTMNTADDSSTSDSDINTGIFGRDILTPRRSKRKSTQNSSKATKSLSKQYKRLRRGDEPSKVANKAESDSSTEEEHNEDNVSTASADDSVKSSKVRRPYKIASTRVRIIYRLSPQSYNTICL